MFGGRVKPPNDPVSIWRESELIARIIAGDSDSFESLIQPHATGLQAMIRRRVRNDADADDVCQEVLVKAFAKLYQFRGNALFSTWLYRIAVNEVRQHFRKQRCANTVALSGHETELPSNAPHALTIVENENARMALHRNLALMPEVDRKALVLFHMRELSVSETARELSMSSNTVKTRLVRARLRLRKGWRSTGFSHCKAQPPARPTAA
jgi:RNA polymerase sigma-70 factor (ECF subfamily)